MDLKTNLKQVEAEARARWDENLRFRRWLKSKNIMEVENAVDRIGREVAAAVDCTQCANCCRALTIVPRSTDIKKLSDKLEIEPYNFKTKYLKKDHEGDLVFKQRPCPFLKGNCCSVYQARPDTCRSYPHLEKSHLTGRGWHVVENTIVCPIVFNTYEILKEHFNYFDRSPEATL
jgi:Fe-S-cluster containining protein